MQFLGVTERKDLVRKVEPILEREKVGQGANSEGVKDDSAKDGNVKDESVKDDGVKGDGAKAQDDAEAAAQENETESAQK